MTIDKSFDFISIIFPVSTKMEKIDLKLSPMRNFNNTDSLALNHD